MTTTIAIILQAYSIYQGSDNMEVIEPLIMNLLNENEVTFKPAQEVDTDTFILNVDNMQESFFYLMSSITTQAKMGILFYDMLDFDNVIKEDRARDSELDAVESYMIFPTSEYMQDVFHKIKRA